MARIQEYGGNIFCFVPIYLHDGILDNLYQLLLLCNPNFLMPFSSKKTPTMFVDQFANSEWPTTAAMFDASHATTTAIGAPSVRPPLIDDQNLKFLDKVKEAKELFLAAKHKVE